MHHPPAPAPPTRRGCGRDSRALWAAHLADGASLILGVRGVGWGGCGVWGVGCWMRGVGCWMRGVGCGMWGVGFRATYAHGGRSAREGCAAAGPDALDDLQEEGGGGVQVSINVVPLSEVPVVPSYHQHPQTREGGASGRACKGRGLRSKSLQADLPPNQDGVVADARQNLKTHRIFNGTTYADGTAGSSTLRCGASPWTTAWGYMLVA